MYSTNRNEEIVVLYFPSHLFSSPILKKLIKILLKMTFSHTTIIIVSMDISDFVY